jgi:GABA(A) receptor-associated protein
VHMQNQPQEDSPSNRCASIIKLLYPDYSNMYNPFTEKKSRVEAEKVLCKYPDRVPVIVTKNIRSQNTPDIDKNKFLVPLDLTVGQFMYVIRKRIKLESSKALFLFVGDSIAPTSELMGAVYGEFQDKGDGFLHVVYSGENTFGRGNLR